MISRELDCEEYRREANVLVRQANTLVEKLNVTVSDVEKFGTGTPEFRVAAEAYERIAQASKTCNPVAWERTTVDGRNGDELLERLWKVREALRQQD